MLQSACARLRPLVTIRAMALCALGALLVLIVVHGRSRGHVHTGDSDVLINGARVVGRCVRDGTFSSCGYVPGTWTTTVGPYPFLQYIPAMLLVSVGLSDDAGLQVLAVLNLVAVVGLILAVLSVWRRRPSHACLVVLAIVATSLLYQATSGFGEALAASVIAGAVLAAMRRRVVTMTALVFLAALSKETLAPFIVVLVLCVARDEGGPLLQSRRLPICAGLGAFGGVVVSVAFNVFRYGTWRNRLYLDPALRTPGIARKLEFFGGILFSPSSGVAWCWPVCFLLLVLVVVVLVRRMRRGGLKGWRQWVSTAGIAGCAVAWLGGLSAWFSPFGWIAYGPRLEVPLLPALVIAIVHVAGDEIIEMVRQTPAIAIAALIAVLLSVLQYQSVWRYSAVLDRLIAPHGSCPAMTVPIPLDSPLYFECTSGAMWKTRPVVLGGLVGADSNDQLATWPLGALASLGLAWGAAFERSGAAHARRSGLRRRAT